MQTFQTGFLCFSNMSFCDLIGHFFLALHNSPLSRYTTVCLPIYLLKDILEASKYWQLLTNKAALDICAGFCLNMSFLLIWVNTKEYNCWIICYAPILIDMEKGQRNLESKAERTSTLLPTPLLLLTTTVFMIHLEITQVLLAFCF